MVNCLLAAFRYLRNRGAVVKNGGYVARRRGPPDHPDGAWVVPPVRAGHPP